MLGCLSPASFGQRKGWSQKASRLVTAQGPPSSLPHGVLSPFLQSVATPGGCPSLSHVQRLKAPHCPPLQCVCAGRGCNNLLVAESQRNVHLSDLSV